MQHVEYSQDLIHAAWLVTKLLQVNFWPERKAMNDGVLVHSLRRKIMLNLLK